MASLPPTAPGVVGSLSVDGIASLTKTYARFRSRTFDRKVFNQPAQNALKALVLPQSKKNARRTHPRSIRRARSTGQSYFQYVDRHPNAAPRWEGRREGPMSKFQKTFKFKKGVGAKIDYTPTGSLHLVNWSLRKAKNFFHPAAQEYGADTAEPSINSNASRPMGKATQQKGNAAIQHVRTNIGPFIDRAVNEARVNQLSRDIRV